MSKPRTPRALRGDTTQGAPTPETKPEEIMSLQSEILREGNGAVATAGQTVTVHYVGTLTDGKKFDSSRDRGQGFTFKLGAGQVIEGWDKGVAGMKIGELRKLTIPAEMGYGSRGFPPVIPANATLVFEVELLGLK